MMMKRVERIVLICVMLVGTLFARAYAQSDSADGPERIQQGQEDRQHVNSSGDMQQEMQEKLEKTNQLYDKITQKIQHTKDPEMKADLTNLQTQLGTFRNDLNNYMSS